MRHDKDCKSFVYGICEEPCSCGLDEAVAELAALRQENLLLRGDNVGQTQQRNQFEAELTALRQEIERRERMAFMAGMAAGVFGDQDKDAAYAFYRKQLNGDV